MAVKQISIWDRISGSLSFGQSAGPNAWLPIVIVVAAMFAVAKFTGIFKPKSRRR